MDKLVKISLTLLMLLVIAVNGIGQNLIPNGDFELGPNQSAEGWGLTVAGPNSWDTVAGTTPDRIYFGDPLGSRDNDTAQSGMAYVEFFGKDTANNLEAEVGRATLLSSLQVGQKYKIRFHLDIDDNFYNGPAGIAFKFNGGDSIASILQPNTGKWESYDTTFIATGISTEIELVAIGGPSLVKVDSILLEVDTTVGLTEYNDKESYLFMYPNPFSNYLNITSIKKNVTDYIISISLYDLYGKQHKPQIDIQSSNIILRKGNIPQGYYFLKIQTIDGIITKKIFIN